MRFFRDVVFATALVLAGSAHAQMVETHLTATNGIVVDLNSDEFAGRYEYSAPSIKLNINGGGSGFALVAKIKKSNAFLPLSIQGSLLYTGEWRYYESAVFKGGDPVDYKPGARNVGSCRYGCSLTEGFFIELSSADIVKHAENGIVAIQLRPTRSSATAMLEVPVAYIEAVNEVAK